MVRRNLETGGGRQLVVRVQRWRVASRAALTLEQPRPIVDRQFDIEFLDAGVEALAFTFG